MAVYTRLSRDQFAAIVDRYAIGAFVKADPIETGVENSNYRLTTDRNRFVLTIFEKRAAPKDLPYFASLLGHLAAKGLPVPPPVADRQGRVIQEVEGKAAWIVPFLPGVSPCPARPGDARAAGRILARLHTASADFPDERANALSLGAWHEMAADVAGQLDGIAPGLRAMIDEELDYLDRHWPRDLPLATIHADLFPDNLLMTDGAVTGLIDFYFACTDFRAYDLAVAHTAWGFADGDRRFDEAIGAALMAGYGEAGSLTAAERAALPVLCRGAALRFLLTRAIDWLAENPDAPGARKDPLDYRERLAFYRAAPERLFAQ